MFFSGTNIKPYIDEMDVDMIKSIPKFDVVEKDIIKYGKHLISKEYKKFTTEEKILALCFASNVLAKELSPDFYGYKNILLIYFAYIPYYNSRNIGIGEDDYGEKILYVDPPMGPQLSFHIKNDYIYDILEEKFGIYKKGWSGRINYKNPIYKYRSKYLGIMDRNLNYILWEKFTDDRKVEIIFPGLKQIIKSKFADKILTLEVKPDHSWSKMSKDAVMIINHYTFNSKSFENQWSRFCSYFIQRLDSFTGLYEITITDIKTPYIDIYINELAYSTGK